MESPTLGQFVAGPWRHACYSRCKASTRRRVDSALRTQLLPTFGELGLHEIGRAAVHHWFDRYSQTAPAGANRTLDVLRQILNYAVACGHLAANPACGVRRNPRPAVTRFLSRREVARLHAALDAHEGRGSGRQQAEIIRLLLLTGCRKGEIVGLRWSEVDGDVLRLQDSKTGPRSVYLNVQARAILARQRSSGSDFVFPALDDPARHRSSELSLWRKARREAGLRDVRLHDLRHTVASHAVMAGAPLPVVSTLLGHRQPRMTLRYAHVGDRDVEAAAERVGSAIAETIRLGRRGPGRPKDVPARLEESGPTAKSRAVSLLALEDGAVSKEPPKNCAGRRLRGAVKRAVKGTAKKISAAQLLNSLGKLLDQLERGGEPVLVCRRRRPAAVLVSVQDYQERFQQGAGGVQKACQPRSADGR